jgi:BRCA1-associated protein
LSLGHARQHYDETLHAYALDTETQHVWDFAGQGYVHRLLQNAQDGKLVEVAQQGTGERQPEAGHLSDQQEDEVVHRKLEGLANQYYALLKSQLEQQRIYYENRLEELQREGNQKTSETSSLIAALKQERRQLQQRLGTLRERYQIVSEEVSFLKNLNESLETNKEQMKRQVQEAQRERDHARAVIQQALPPLEERLYHLMLQLEEDSKPAAT